MGSWLWDGCGYGGDCGYDPECEEEVEAVCGNDITEGDEEGADEECDGEVWCNRECKKKHVINVFMDLDYRAETKKPLSELGRGFSPDPNKISPYDSIVCELKTPKSSNPPKTYQGGLLWVDQNGATGVIKETRAKSEFTLAKNDNDNIYDYYRWKIRGWPDSWVTGEKLEVLVEKGAVRCYVTIDGKRIKGDVIKVETCVRITGKDNADFKIINLRGKSANLNAKGVFKKGAENRILLSEKDPFRRYPEKFSYYVDLKAHDDSVWTTIRAPGGSGFSWDKVFVNHWIVSDKKNAYKQVPKISSCGDDGKLYNFYSDITRAGYTDFGTRVIFMNSQSGSASALHETGHQFCNLLDEYSYILKNLFYSGEKNCVKNPSEEVPSGFTAKVLIPGDMVYNPVTRIYGDANHGNGCSYGFGFFTPSSNSIMNKHLESFSFNVISCGYCLGKITKKEDKNSLIKHLEACMNTTWNTIKPGEIACRKNHDCTTDKNEGCGRCQSDNKCIFYKVEEGKSANECRKPDESAESKWVAGTCEKRDDLKSTCNAVEGWECVSYKNGAIAFACPLENAEGKNVKSCKDHKCVYT
jgi:hypothetical protein